MVGGGIKALMVATLILIGLIFAYYAGPEVRPRWHSSGASGARYRAASSA